ncbi:hypothetical protein HC251_10450 [Iamia sp. SCSIO 61187]|uniref:hypothetical protein n=1 Tax=Iamia sp. SCSIO 61187 TaxID=2722752 RepID=UPI001C62765A|nr:hypothetical protein [Iamia sp. SCSIO 61187]QYG92807.1 hypothetical protein HC251_10450 [Iamia sp. SCSIO 61187]
MLVVCALALVAAAAFFLVVGLAGGDIGDLYLSMVLCVASLVVVAVSARVSRARPEPASDGAPHPLPPAGDDPTPEPSARPVLALATAGARGSGGAEEASIWAAGPSAPPDLAPASGSAPAGAGAPDGAPRPGPEPQAEPEPEPAPEVEPAAATVDVTDAPFPIADYDALDAAQILPLVPKLWPEEVPVVAERERTTRARPAVLDALAEAAGDPALAFPIAEYESLDTEQITGLLARLDAADLATVQVAERCGPARAGVLVAVADQLAARK